MSKYTTPIGPATMSVMEAAELLGVGRTLAYQLAASGQLPTIQLGRRVVVLRAPLMRLLDGQGVLPPEDD